MRRRHECREIRFDRTSLAGRHPAFPHSRCFAPWAFAGRNERWRNGRRRMPCCQRSLRRKQWARPAGQERNAATLHAMIPPCAFLHARIRCYAERAMPLRSTLLLLISALFASAQTPGLPADVDSKSYSRLPLLTREKMTPEQLKVMDKIAKDRPAPPLGPQATSLYSPGVAEPVDALNQYLRKTVVGQHYFEICAMIGAWEMENAYEFSAHEAGARRAGVDS